MSARGIDRLPSGKYRVRVHIGGGRYRSKSFTRLRDAERWRQDMQAAKETGRVAQVDADMQPFRDLITEHVAAKRAAGWEERTWATYRSLLDAHLRPHPLADLPLRAITPHEVERFRDDLRAANVGVESIRKLMMLCQSAHDRAVRFGRASTNPWKAVERFKRNGSREDVKVVGPQAVEDLRAQLKGEHAVFVSVLAYAGLRPGEARGLHWGDIGARTIRVREGVNPDGSAKGTKTGKARTVRLLAPLADDLAAWRLTSGKPADGALVFPMPDGSGWPESKYQSFRSKVFSRAVRAAGVALDSPYDLRHSAASLWLHEGVNPVQVAAWMGHSLAMLSRTYAHVIGEVSPDDRRSAADMIRAARAGRDIPVTWIGDRRSQSAVMRSTG